MPEFTFFTSPTATLGDEEINQLLVEVYVKEGFTTNELATTLFQGSAVRKRGKIFFARASQSGSLAGMVILVRADSPASRIAKLDADIEIHLLAVHKRYRNLGLGEKLMTHLLNDAKEMAIKNIFLFTQTNMYAAHKLYRRLEFSQLKGRDFKKAGKEFTVWHRFLNT